MMVGYVFTMGVIGGFILGFMTAGALAMREFNKLERRLRRLR